MGEGERSKRSWGLGPSGSEREGWRLDLLLDSVMFPVGSSTEASRCIPLLPLEPLEGLSPPGIYGSVGCLIICGGCSSSAL